MGGGSLGEDRAVGVVADQENRVAAAYPATVPCGERPGRSGSPLRFRSTATFAIPTGVRIEALAAAVAIGVVIKAILF